MAGYVYDASDVQYKNYEYGFYNNESINGDKVRWIMREACTEVLAQSDQFGLSLYADLEMMPGNKQSVDIIINDIHMDKILWKKKGFKHRYYHIPGIKGTRIKIRIIAENRFLEI